jgi:translation initiation factor 1
MHDKKTKLVYSTDRAISRKEKPVEKALHTRARPAQQKVTVRLERKGRGGKSVTVIEGLQMPWKEREVLLKTLKMKLGTGGTVKETSLEIQGDHRDGLMEELEKRGYSPKRSGGG